MRTRYVYNQYDTIMTNTPPRHNASESTSSLKQTVLARIDQENVCPRGRWLFHSRECVVWTLWLVTVLVGALAVAVSLFVIAQRQYALYEATHDNFLTFLVTVLPYLWIITSHHGVFRGGEFTNHQAGLSIPSLLYHRQQHRTELCWRRDVAVLWTRVRDRSGAR